MLSLFGRKKNENKITIDDTVDEVAAMKKNYYSRLEGNYFKYNNTDKTRDYFMVKNKSVINLGKHMETNKATTYTEEGDEDLDGHRAPGEEINKYSANFSNYLNSFNSYIPVDVTVDQPNIYYFNSDLEFLDKVKEGDKGRIYNKEEYLIYEDYLPVDTEYFLKIEDNMISLGKILEKDEQKRINTYSNYPDDKFESNKIYYKPTPVKEHFKQTVLKIPSTENEEKFLEKIGIFPFKNVKDSFLESLGNSMGKYETITGKIATGKNGNSIAGFNPEDIVIKRDTNGNPVINQQNLDKYKNLRLFTTQDKELIELKDNISKLIVDSRPNPNTKATAEDMKNKNEEDKINYHEGLRLYKRFYKFYYDRSYDRNGDRLSRNYTVIDSLKPANAKSSGGKRRKTRRLKKSRVNTRKRRGSKK